MSLLLALLACGSQGDLELTPRSVEWGEVNFQNEPCTDCECDAGCGPTELTLLNEGEADLNVQLPNGYDGERLCIAGFPEYDEPIDLGVIAPDSSYTLTLSVCGYVVGTSSEQGEALSGTMTFITDGEKGAVELEWSFTPIRDFEDTGIF